MTAAEPPWLMDARAYLGVAEIPGREHSPIIQRWLRDLRAWWSDDETAWCGALPAYVFRERGIRIPPHWYRARAWLDWGQPLILPRAGCVVVFERGGGGHVGFVVGEYPDGRLAVLGGNQGNRVSIAPFDRARVLGYRWPPGLTAIGGASLPVMASTRTASSSNEA